MHDFPLNSELSILDHRTQLFRHVCKISGANIYIKIIRGKYFGGNIGQVCEKTYSRYVRRWPTYLIYVSQLTMTLHIRAPKCTILLMIPVWDICMYLIFSQKNMWLNWLVYWFDSDWMKAFISNENPWIKKDSIYCRLVDSYLNHNLTKRHMESADWIK